MACPGPVGAGAFFGLIHPSTLVRVCPEGASAAAADRRVHVAMQIAARRRRATPRDGLAGARKITDAIAFGLGAERSAKPADDAQRLTISLNMGVDPADVGLLCPGFPCRLLAMHRGAHRDPADDRQKTGNSKSHLVSRRTFTGLTVYRGRERTTTDDRIASTAPDLGQ